MGDSYSNGRRQDEKARRKADAEIERLKAELGATRAGVVLLADDLAKEVGDTVWLGPTETLHDRVMILLDYDDYAQLEAAIQAARAKGEH